MRMKASAGSMLSPLFGFRIGRLELLPMRLEIGLRLLERRRPSVSPALYRVIDQNQVFSRARGCRVLIQPADLRAVFTDRPILSVRIARDGWGAVLACCGYISGPKAAATETLGRPVRHRVPAYTIEISRTAGARDSPRPSERIQRPGRRLKGQRPGL
jgi:hypothetical protein